VFEFVHRREEEDDEIEIDEEEGSSSLLECRSRGSFRVDEPLSAFAALDDDTNDKVNATALAEYLMPALNYAAAIVPPKYYESTRVYYQATAGMRLLSQRQQHDVYDAVYQGLFLRNDFVFKDTRRDDIGTLSGESEGYYGAVAANYLKGTVAADLRIRRQRPERQGEVSGDRESNRQLVRASSSSSSGPIGALDMGGASTQIVFLRGGGGSSRGDDDDEEYQYCNNERQDVSADAPSERRRQQQVSGDNNNEYYYDDDHDGYRATPSPARTCRNVVGGDSDIDGVPSRLDDRDFFATSYLSYGVDQFRERLWTKWVTERKRQVDKNEECDSKVLPNPCCYKGYEIEWDGYTLVGTGDTDSCVKEVRKLIPHPERETEYDASSAPSESGRRVVGGIEHPPVRGKFFAMSLYFFALDSLRELSRPDKEAHEALNLSWPTPSIRELHNALDGLCSRSWKGDLEEIQHEAHAYARPEVLPHRCLESVYMVTLLRDGFGFDPDSRDITFTFHVDGSEVEWTLGMALALRAQQQGSSADKVEGVSQPDSSIVMEQGEKRENDTTLDGERDDDDDDYFSYSSLTGMYDLLIEVVKESEHPFSIQ